MSTSMVGKAGKAGIITCRKDLLSERFPRYLNKMIASLSGD